MPPLTSRLERLLTLMIVVFVVLHYLRLQADFPMHQWSESAAFTDEGWWSSAAVNAFHTGQWYVAGDYNPAVATPVFPALIFVVFKIFATTSLLIARATAVTCFVLVLLLGYYFARRIENHDFALVATLIFASSFYVFAMSRLALLEFPMMVFVMAGLCIAVSPGTRPLLAGFAIGVCLALAVLVKMSAGFAIVPVGYLLYARTSSRSAFLKSALAAGLTSALLVLPYLKFVRSHYSADIRSFVRIQAHLDLAHSPLQHLGASAFRAVLHGWAVGAVVYPLALVGAVTCAMVLRSTRPLFCVSALWILSYWAYLSARAYAPGRYYIVIFWPVVFVLLEFARAAFAWNRRAGIACALALCVVCCANAYRILAYLSHPTYTFATMASDVQRRVSQGTETKRLLIGHFAATVALAHYVPSLCAVYGTMSVQEKIAAFNPGYLIIDHPFQQPSDEVDFAISQRYQPKLISSYPIFEHRAAYLYQLISKRTDATLVPAER